VALKVANLVDFRIDDSERVTNRKPGTEDIPNV
jgi:hypothetical protein